MASPKFVVERTHKVAGAVFYLSPGRINWVTPWAHETYGTRYGKWLQSEGEAEIRYYEARSANFTYRLVPAEQFIKPKTT